MDKQPFFSIVIPVYNSEKYLDDCIKSVFCQSCQDFELILVDDESKDSSPQICDKWKSEYPENVKVIHQKNAGVYIAKRNGVRATSGKYIYIIDNDDLITSSDALESVRKKISESQCDLVIFNAIDNMETCHKLCSIPFEDGEIFENERLAYIYDEYLNTKSFHHIWMMIFNRELFDWDYEYNEPFRMLRDGPALTLPIISNAKKILYLEASYYYWRTQNETSASKHYDVLYFFYSIRLLHKRVMDYANTWKFKSDKTESFLKKNYIADVCIAAIKVRSLSEQSKIGRKECLKMMANDEMFREEYSLKYLEGFRKPVAFFLYHKQYWIVNIISSLVGAVKGR